jgi:hypothetical protein
MNTSPQDENKTLVRDSIGFFCNSNWLGPIGVFPRSLVKSNRVPHPLEPRFVIGAKPKHLVHRRLRHKTPAKPDQT